MTCEAEAPTGLPRITVEEVREAVEKTGIKLVSGDWGNGRVGSEACSGCAMTALWLAVGHGPEINHCSARDWAYRKYGTNYAFGFIDGFDDGYDNIQSNRYVEGVADGKAVRASLIDSRKNQSDDTATANMAV